jgi:hypothetical protein
MTLKLKSSKFKAMLNEMSFGHYFEECHSLLLMLRRNMNVPGHGASQLDGPQERHVMNETHPYVMIEISTVLLS